MRWLLTGFRFGADVVVGVVASLLLLMGLIHPINTRHGTRASRAHSRSIDPFMHYRSMIDTSHGPHDPKGSSRPASIEREQRQAAAATGTRKGGARVLGISVTAAVPSSAQRPQPKRSVKHCRGGGTGGTHDRLDDKTGRGTHLDRIRPNPRSTQSVDHRAHTWTSHHQTPSQPWPLHPSQHPAGDSSSCWRPRCSWPSTPGACRRPPATAG